jgi:hypothetical protein
MPGIASEGPIAWSIHGLGLTRIIERAERLFDEPIYGFVAGLHYPLTASRLKRTGLPLQKFLGTGKLRWQRVTRDEVREAIAFLSSKKAAGGFDLRPRQL